MAFYETKYYFDGEKDRLMVRQTGTNNYNWHIRVYLDGKKIIDTKGLQAWRLAELIFKNYTFYYHIGEDQDATELEKKVINKCPNCDSKNYITLRYIREIDKYLNECKDCYYEFTGVELNNWVER